MKARLTLDNHDMSTWPNDLVIFEDAGFEKLLPLAYWRAVFELRCGCRTLRERICHQLRTEEPALYVRDYLKEVTSLQQLGRVCQQIEPAGRTLFVNGRALLWEPIEQSPVEVAAWRDNQLLYVWADQSLAKTLTAQVFLDHERLSATLERVPSVESDLTLIEYPWELVHQNIKALEADWATSGNAGIAGKVYAGAHLLAQENITIGPGSVIKPGTVLDAEPGPIMIGENVTIRPNCTLEGPLFIGDKSLIQPGAVINEGVSIGPVCKVGGELESSIIHSHSNKQHDGFLGHSYVGQWVNLAADTINSDLKNTYGPVRVPINGREVDSGEMFVGLTVGDHSKTSVNSMFSTGSVVGFGCSVFSSRFAPRFVPSFSWLTDSGCFEAIPEKTVAVAEQVMARRNVPLSEPWRQLFLRIPELARRYEVPMEPPSE